MARRGMQRDMPERRQQWTPRKRSRHSRKTTTVAVCALAALVLLTGGLLVWRMTGYGAARDEYAGYQAMEAIGADADASFEAVLPEGTSPPGETAPPPPTAIPAFVTYPTFAPFYSAKVASLQKDNRDAVAWLDIADTEMQYPVVQGKDNEYYMARTFKKKKNASGAIFMDCWNAPDFTDFNTVIYGHNMNDGSMFAGLREYRHQNFFDGHPTIEITLLNQKLTYRVFAAYVSQGEDSADFRGQTCATEEQRSAFIKAARKRSTDIRCSLTVSRYDRLLTLVTCTGGTHSWYWVVHAVLAEEQLTAE